MASFVHSIGSQSWVATTCPTILPSHHVTIHIAAGRMLSLGWHCDGQVLFCGGDKSVIRKVAVPERKCSLNMTVEDFGGDPTLVWTIRVLR